jgi:transposase
MVPSESSTVWTILQVLRAVPNTRPGCPREALGRSPGGFSTQLHLAVDAGARPVELTVTAGAKLDMGQASRLLAEREPKYVIADKEKEYDGDDFIRQIEERGSKAVIPARNNRNVQRHLLRRHDRPRNQTERFVNRIKYLRRVATRYAEAACNFLGFVQLATLFCWLNINTN